MKGMFKAGFVAITCSAVTGAVTYGFCEIGGQHAVAAEQAQFQANERAKTRAADIEARAQLGIRQLKGMDGTRYLGPAFADDRAGLDNLIYAAGAGNATAMLALVDYYGSPRSLLGMSATDKPRDAKAASAWLAKVEPLVRQGSNADSFVQLAGRLGYEPGEKGYALMLRAANLGNCGAMALLIRLQDDADRWGPKMIKRATDDPADGECPELIGTEEQVDLTWPTKPIVQSDQPAVYWWKLALSRGNYHALYYLERAYEVGDGGVPADPWQACEYSRLRALYNGYSDSERKVGLCYLKPPKYWPHDAGKGRYWLALDAAQEYGPYRVGRDARRRYPGPVSPDAGYATPPVHP